MAEELETSGTTDAEADWQLAGARGQEILMPEWNTEGKLLEVAL